MFLPFDPLYLIMMAPVLLLSLVAQVMVKSAFGRYSKVPSTSGLSGARAARRMLEANGLTGVGIERVAGRLSDHYDPIKRVLRLSPEVHDGASVASVGVACHEAGHALQHAKGYVPLYLRTALVPLASFGSNGGIWIMIVGVLMTGMVGVFGYYMALAGFGLFAAAVLFSLVTLPVEFNASSRAKTQLAQLGVIHGEEEARGVNKVLNAAALTYVAGAIAAIVSLLYWAIRLGLVGGRDD